MRSWLKSSAILSAKDASLRSDENPEISINLAIRASDDLKIRRINVGVFSKRDDTQCNGVFLAVSLDCRPSAFSALFPSFLATADAANALIPNALPFTAKSYIANSKRFNSNGVSASILLLTIDAATSSSISSVIPKMAAKLGLDSYSLRKFRKVGMIASSMMTCLFLFNCSSLASAYNSNAASKSLISLRSSPISSAMAVSFFCTPLSSFSLI